MRVAIIASEAVPWCKTGGLADVVGALPQALVDQSAGKVAPATFLPLYRQVRESIANDPQLQLVETGVEVAVPFSLGPERARFFEVVGHGGPPVYVLDAPHRYDRPRLYDDESGKAYPDNLYRYALLCRGALEAATALMGGVPDVVHAHDWQGGLALAYLRTRYLQTHAHTGAVMTIHNLAYQGLFAGEHRHNIDLDPSAFNLERAEYFGGLNLLKAGIAYADVTTTVSETYAQEITTPDYGCGLDGFLQARGAGRLCGIVNGVDTDVWSPATDKALPANYSVDKLAGKATCRQQLLAEMGLESAEGEPVLGIVSRFTGQKGLDLVADLVPHLHALGARLIVLGSGDAQLEHRFRYLAECFGDHLAVRVGFDPKLARRIFAGSDILLMPSRFEPCGLNQLYAMHYGTVPVVHAVGGLRDTVLDPGDQALARGEGTGFCFEHPTVVGLHWALERAVKMYRQNPRGWQAVVRSGMTRDVSWAKPARAYLDLYHRVRSR